DVKHVEVGLTDKSDAMRVLFREVAGPLRIRPEDVLVLGDEFGAIAGFEGSDHKMLDVPEVAGATVVSVGPEPGGAPDGVLHLGGGPERFCELLERQLALEEELGPFAPPRDAAWIVEEPGFDVAREHEIESLLAIGNGYVGSRASISEGTSVSRPATFLAGAFETSNDVARVPELVVVPRWSGLSINVEGERLDVETASVSEHRRVLDMRRGRLLHEGRATLPSGRVARIRAFRFASLADRHLLVQGVELEPENFSGHVGVETWLRGDVRSASGASHWARFEPLAGAVGASGEASWGPTLVGETHGGLVAALASHTRVVRPAAKVAFERASDTTWASERCAFPARLDERSELVRTVSLYTSRDAADPRASADGARARVAAVPATDLAAAHERAWAERWRKADVEIAGAPKLERALRFAAYHLISAANPDDPRCSIGARALTGEAYRGHVFWDTDVFMLPFFMATWPEAARAMLCYRHRTLGGAREKARTLGYAGALYAWESADTGEETTPARVLTPFGDVIRVLSGEQEHHISADVAWAVWLYGRLTGDRGFLAREGFDILVETARFWASRGVMRDDGHVHIERVIGPDEYHEEIDDNAFTNWMARFNMLEAADAIDEASPEMRARLGVTPDEAARFRDVAARIRFAQDPKTGLIEQFAGFERLEYVDLTAFGSRHAPMDVILGRARTQVSQVVKQADVVQLLAMRWDDFEPDARRANFLYYEPRTAHGSSLSPGIHALVAARLGLASTAARYFDQTADIDLGNNMGNAAGGVHAAGLGSLWLAVVFGACGVRPSPTDPEALVVEPNLLPAFRHVVVPFTFRGAELSIAIEPTAIEVEAAGAAPAKIVASAGDGRTSDVVVEPGRRYAVRRTGDGYAAWEEIR
ncbi:MAG TPA: glycoside hydrolase family 65 protein, partial [Minicystis sp.]|nr:glycoside hydrolase family 65 protein [Minicystis sp.]